MATTSNKRSIEATFSELLDKIQKLTASNMRRLEELVEKGVYIPGSNPDDNSEMMLPNGKHDVTRKSPTKPVEDQMLGDVVNGPAPEDDDVPQGEEDDGFDDGAVDGDAIPNEVPQNQEESTEDPEVRNAQTNDDRVQNVEVKQLDDFDDGYSVDIFDDDGTVCEDEEGNEECLVVSLNGLHSKDDIGQIDCFETTIAPIYDNNGNIDEIALRDAAFKRASEVLDAEITDADTIVLQTKQDANRKMHEAEDNLAFLPANYYAEDNTPTTVLFPNGTTSELAQMIGNNPILDPIPQYVKDADHEVMPPTCIGSSQNADWAPYVCLVKRPALLGGFSISIASMSDEDMAGDKHAVGLRNKGIKELHNDLQTFAKYYNGTVINRPKEGTDADADADEENCICTYKSVPKTDDEEDLGDEDFFLGEADGESEQTPDPSASIKAEMDAIQNGIKTPEDSEAAAKNAQAKADATKVAADTAVQKSDELLKSTETDAVKNTEDNTADMSKAIDDLNNNDDVKNGGDLKAVPKTDDAFLSKFGGEVTEGDEDDFDEDDDIVPDDEESLSSGDSDNNIIAEIPFPGFKVGDGENKMFLDVIERVFSKDGAIYKRIVSRSIPDRKFGPEKIASVVCDDDAKFIDICNTIAEDWVSALNEFIQTDAFRFDGPVDLGPEGFDDQIYAVVDPEFAEKSNIEPVEGGEVSKDIILRNVFEGRSEDEFFDDVIVETNFIDTAVADVEKVLLDRWYSDIQKTLSESII